MKVTKRRCQCAGCGQYFNAISAFDKHRTGDFRSNARRCKTVEEMKAAGMRLNYAGFWTSGGDFKWR